ncbi:MAG: phosphatase PAP2 family protein [Promethearchaeota archaeon]
MSSKNNDFSKSRVDYKEYAEIKWVIVSISLGLLLFFTWLFRYHGGALDIKITEAFYFPSQSDKFPLGNQLPWSFFNENEKLFLILNSLVGLILLLIGIIDKKRKIFVRYGLFVIFTIIIGAGIIVNFIFKEHWGRWRPLQTTLFGGTQPFYKLWEPAWLIQPDSIGNGVSFSSGHPCSILVAIGIFFVFNHPEFIVRYFGEYRPYKLYLAMIIKYSALFFSFFGGLIMGFARIVAGKHFASDVMYTFFFIYATAYILYYYVFKIPTHEKKIIERDEQKRINE